MNHSNVDGTICPPPQLIQGVSHRSVFFKLTLTDRKMQAKICLKVVLTSLDYGI